MSGGYRFFNVPVDVATTPFGTGCLVNQWWIVDPEKGLLFCYHLANSTNDDPWPQCNSDEKTAKILYEKMYPDFELRLIPIVFTIHANSIMRRDRDEYLREKAKKKSPQLEF